MFKEHRSCQWGARHETAIAAYAGIKAWDTCMRRNATKQRQLGSTLQGPKFQTLHYRSAQRHSNANNYCNDLIDWFLCSFLTKVFLAISEPKSFWAILYPTGAADEISACPYFRAVMGAQSIKPVQAIWTPIENLWTKDTNGIPSRAHFMEFQVLQCCHHCWIHFTLTTVTTEWQSLLTTHHKVY